MSERINISRTTEICRQRAELAKLNKKVTTLTAQLSRAREVIRQKDEAFEEIALMGMSAPVGCTESEEKTFQARQARYAIGVAAKALALKLEEE